MQISQQIKSAFTLKFSLAAMLLGTALWCVAPAHARPANLTGCDAKRAALEQELAYARQYGNTHRIQGLERALSNVNTYCTDESLKAELEQDVAQKELEVREREADLREAIAKGDPDKIASREEKLAEARYELAEAKRRLAELGASAAQ